MRRTALSSRDRPRLLPFWIIAGLCIATELAIWAAGLADLPYMRAILVQYAGFWPGLLGDWQANFRLQPATMFATYWAVHASPWHLLGNLLILGWIAPRLGPHLSPLQSAEIWAISVLGGGIAYGLLSQTPTPMVGASGGLFGLIGALIVLRRHLDASRLGPRRAALEAIAACVGLLMLSLLDVVLRDGALAWQAHLGGFLAGAALLWSGMRK